MFNKNTKIIILGIVILFLSLVLIFIFKIQGKNEASNTVNKISVVATSTNVSQENVISQKSKEENNAKFLAELKNNHPEYSAAQLKFYGDTAAKDEMIPCLGKDDESNCVAAVAFISQAYNFCGEIKDKKTQIECSDAILAKEAAEEISKCSSNVDDLKTQCLVSIFQIYKQPEDCANLKEETRKICEDVTYYQMALLQDNRKLCAYINNGYLKTYCSKNIVEKALDSDNDGITDDEELNKYHTDPKNPDTDGDGYKDGDEVKNGFNPNGSGKLIINK